MTSWSVTGMPVLAVSETDSWAEAAGAKAGERNNVNGVSAAGSKRGLMRRQAGFLPLPVLPLPGLIASLSLPLQGDARTLMPVGDLNDRKQADTAQSSF